MKYFIMSYEFWMIYLYFKIIILFNKHDHDFQVDHNLQAFYDWCL
jgi:hypothetical protein